MPPSIASPGPSVPKSTDHWKASLNKEKQEEVRAGRGERRAPTVTAHQPHGQKQPLSIKDDGHTPEPRPQTGRNPTPAPAQADREDVTLSDSQTQDKHCVTPLTFGQRGGGVGGGGEGGARAGRGSDCAMGAKRKPWRRRWGQTAAQRCERH